MKRRAVNYTVESSIESNSKESLSNSDIQINKNNSQDLKPALPARKTTISSPNSTRKETLIQRKTPNNFLSISTPKKLFTNDQSNIKVQNFDQTSNDDAGNQFLRRSNTLKDLRKNLIRNNDDNASIESSKSIRDEAASKIRNAFTQLDVERKRNEVLEQKLRELGINPNSLESVDKPANIKVPELLVEIEDLVSRTISLLDSTTSKVSTNCSSSIELEKQLNMSDNNNAEIRNEIQQSIHKLETNLAKINSPPPLQKTSNPQKKVHNLPTSPKTLCAPKSVSIPSMSPDTKKVEKTVLSSPSEKLSLDTKKVEKTAVPSTSEKTLRLEPQSSLLQEPTPVSLDLEKDLLALMSGFGF
ncbi:hypothetical protein HDV02_003541 [Globomyces sp. JEL0801]|nr:hypothetical protein HDV02_003541 [Globomyces sp. JEL0801]